MELLKKVWGWFLALLLWLWWLVPKTLDWIGRSTLPEDWRQLMNERLPAMLSWLFSTPGWVPGLLAAVLTIWLIWISWPRSSYTSALSGNPTDFSAPQTAKRKLTAFQKATIAKVLAYCEKPQKRFAVMYFGASEECAEYAEDIAESLRMAGWSAIAEPPFFSGDPLRKGLQLSVKNKQVMPVQASFLCSALKDAGVDFYLNEVSASDDDELFYVYVGRAAS